jgi:hypothetical protein
MSPDHETATPTLPDADTAGRLRDVLERAGYAGTRPLQMAEVKETDLAGMRPEGKQLIVALRRTSGDAPLDTLVRLFLLGRAVPLDRARRAVAPTDLGDWVTARLLDTHGEEVRARFLLAPVRGLWVASDARWRDQPTELHVMGVGGSSLKLADLTVRRRCGRALDLGAGGGVQALLAAAHCDRVLATDRNPRAVAFAAFNARLNGREQIEAREGDLFEPARGEAFDLIVSNPPFVISPERRYLYRDGGRPGDELLHELLREAPPHLREGGYCQIVCEWAHLRGQDWRERLTGWLAGSGCDAWVIRTTTRDPLSQAETWVFAGGDDPEGAAAQMNEWAAWYEANGIEAISVGFITLRRRSGGHNWLRFDDPPLLRGSVGEAIEHGFALRDFLEARPGAALLDERLCVAPNLRWEQQMSPSPNGWAITDAQMRLDAGLSFVGAPNQYVIGLLDRCRGRAPLREVLADLAASVGGELDAEDVLDVVRRLVEEGFLLPAGA